MEEDELNDFHDPDFDLDDVENSAESMEDAEDSDVDIMDEDEL